MHWKGYAGGTAGEGGALGCKGAMRLQWLQVSRRAMMARVMPGQSTVLSPMPSWKSHLGVLSVRHS